MILRRKKTVVRRGLLLAGLTAVGPFLVGVGGHIAKAQYGPSQIPLVNNLVPPPLATQVASYTLLLTNAGYIIEINVTSPDTAILYIPTNASVAFPTNTILEVFQAGTGQIGVQAVTPATTTIQSPTGTYTTFNQYSSLGVRKRSTDTWVLSGDLTQSVLVPIQANYITNQDVSVGWGTTGATVSTPDIIRETAVTSAHNISNNVAATRAAAIKTFCFFSDITPIGADNWIKFTVWDSTFVDFAACIFNVAGCAVGTTSSNVWTSVSGAVLPMGGAKVRCLLYFTTDATTINFFYQFALTPDGTTFSYLGVVSNGVNADNTFLYNVNAGAGGS